MHFVYLLVSLIAAALTVWALTVRRRRAEDVEGILKDLHSGLPDCIYETVDGLVWDDEELWRMVDGWTGLRMLLRNAGLFVAAMKILADQFPEKATEEYRELWWKALYLRYCFMGCMIESVIRRAFPIPRIQVRECVRLYCDISESFQVVLGNCDRTLGNIILNNSVLGR